MHGDMLPIYLNGLILQNPKHSVFVVDVVLIPAADPLTW